MRVKIESFLREVCEKTTKNSEYPVLTSSKSGLFLQSDYFNKQVASTDNTGYKIIKKGQFTYRAMSDTGEFYPNMLECVDVGIVSPAYPVFEIFQTDLIIPEYLKYYFKSNAFQHAISSFAQGSTRTSVKFNKLKTASIDLPSKQEQTNILRLLKKAETLIASRQQELQKLDDLVKARFVEMFGDPKSNPHEYEKPQLKETCKVITGNTPSRAIREYYGDCLEWIKTDNIVSGVLNPTAAVEKLSRSGVDVGRTVDAGTILMACIAGSIASIGRVCVTDRKVAFNQQINAIVPQKYNVLFLYTLLQISKDYLVEEINMALKGILSKSKLEEKHFILPPMESQDEFASFVEQVDKSKFVVQQALDKAQLFFDSLMQQYFG